MTNRAMKVLVIGLGGIAKRHIDAIRKLEGNYEIACLRRYPEPSPLVDRLFTNWDEARAYRPDVALVCSPTARHTEDVAKLVAMRVPFLLEKPVAADLGCLGDLAAEIERERISVYVACQLRFDPLIVYIKKQLDGGGLPAPQRVRVFCHSYLPSWRPQRDYRDIYSARTDLGGGVGLDLIHEFDYVKWWFGMPEGLCGFRAKVSGLAIDCDDQCSAVLNYDKTVVEISLSYAEKRERRGFELAYEDAVYYGDLMTGELAREESGGERAVVASFPRDKDDIFVEQMRHFLDCVRTGNPSMNTYRDGADVLSLVLRLNKAF